MNRLAKTRSLIVLLLAAVAACTSVAEPALQEGEPPPVITVLVVATRVPETSATLLPPSIAPASATPAPSATSAASATRVPSTTPSPSPLPTAAPTLTAPKLSASGSVKTALVGPVPEGGSITVGVVGNTNLDVNAMTPFMQSAIYNSLLQPNPLTGALEPGLAESYRVSNDGTTMTFQLRPNVRWHNGELLSALDVAATISALAASDFSGTPVTDFGSSLTVSAIDDLTVQVAFRESYCPALAYIGTMKVLPRAVVQSENFPHLTPAQVIGTGPLRLLSQGSNQFVFARYTNYYAGTPHIEGWTLKLFPDAATLRAAFVASQVDVMALGPRDYRALSGLANANVIATESTELVMLLFNTDHYILNNGRVRQALAQALDPTQLLDDVGRRGKPAIASALPGSWAYPKDLVGNALDLGKAKQLLAEAGWRDGGDGIVLKDRKPLNLQLWTEGDDPILEPLAFRIREMLAGVGAQVELELDDRPGWITRAFQHRFDLLLLSREIPLDLDQSWYWQSDQSAKGTGFNFGSYSSSRVDQLSRESRRVRGCEPAVRSAYFAEINRNLIADVPAVFLFAPYKYLAAHERVLGLAPSTFAGDFWDLEDWGVK